MKKTTEFLQNPHYINLSSLGYSIADIKTDDVGVKFEKEIDGYYCFVYLSNRKIVLTAFFNISDDVFKEKFKIIESLFNKYSWTGRNFIENRISFKNTTTEEIDIKMNELVSVLKTQGFPPMHKDLVILKMKK